MTERIHPAGVRIDDDDATIAAALEDVSIPTLMMSMVHMTGDTSILRGPIRPTGIFLNEVQGFMSEDDKATVRAQALEVIKAYRDGGCELAPPPSPETIHEMMCFMVGGDVPAEYVPMMLEEMELDGTDVREFHWDREVSDEAKQAFHVVVIGGGMSGLLAAIRLKEAGIPCTVIEKNPSVGGTWFENTYPGCRVDVGNHRRTSRRAWTSMACASRSVSRRRSSTPSTTRKRSAGRCASAAGRVGRRRWSPVRS
jgi:4-hydroxyacetophenone monooxygenase